MAFSRFTMIHEKNNMIKEKKMELITGADYTLSCAHVFDVRM